MQTSFQHTELWSKEFGRNNKQLNHKNLRCFPFCSENGHVEHGFCGRPIEFHISRKRASRSMGNEIYAFGQFQTIGDAAASRNDNDVSMEIKLGDVFTLKQLMANTKDPKSAKAETLDKPLFEGMLPISNRTSSELTFAFNVTKKGWTYNWLASKHKSTCQHTFFVYLFEGTLNSLVCVGAHASPSFVVLCRKKPGFLDVVVTKNEESPEKRVQLGDDVLLMQYEPYFDEEEVLDLVDPIVETRMELLLPALYAQFTKEGGAPDFFDAMRDWSNSAIGDEEEQLEDDDFVLPVPALVANTQTPTLLGQLAKYLVEENTLSESVRQIVNFNFDKKRTRRAVVNAFYGEVAEFLKVSGYLEQDLDIELQRVVVVNNAHEDVHVNALVEQLTKVAIHHQQQQQETTPMARDTPVPLHMDISGNWRLDDTLIQALDECRMRRGVPTMVRQMVSRTEREFSLHHTRERIVMGIKNKLFSSTSEEFVLDNQERPLSRVLPIPYSNNEFTEETAVAWTDNDTVKQFRTYGGTVRTYMAMRKRGENEIEMNIHYLEKRPAGNEHWQCVFAKRGIATRLLL